MNNNSTLFYEYTLTQKFEINDIHDLSFDFDSYNDVFEKLNGFSPKISENIIKKLLEFAGE